MDTGEMHFLIGDSGTKIDETAPRPVTTTLFNSI